MMQSPSHVVLFDGICNFCDSSVQWLILRDRKKIFRFTGLQTETGQEILSEFEIDENSVDSIIYIRDERVYIKSSAVLEILKDLGSGWKLLYVFKLIPVRVRDYFYDQFAKRRYRLFGKRTECRIPDKDELDRFL